jgi:hypothetical protein
MKIFIFLTCMLFAATTFSQSLLPVQVATSSHTYSGSPPTAAIDGNTNTSWSSGVFAAVSPYIQLDLGTDKSVSQIKLLTGQSPSGTTTHVVTGYTSGGTQVSIGTLSGNTSDNQWLNVNTSTAVRHVRITTTQSPSWVGWREIQVYGPTTPSGTINASPGSCAIITPDLDCDTTLTWATSNAGVSRIWIRSGPTNAGGWLTEGVSGSQAVAWIRAGTYVFDLRQGTSSSGTLLASVSVTGVQQTNNWVSAWGSRPCVVGAADGLTPLLASYSFNDCPSAQAKRFWVAPAVAMSVYTNCTTNPNSINCTSTSGSQLVLKAGNAYNAYSAPMDGLQLISETSFPKSSTIDMSVQLTPTCSYIQAGSWDGCYIGLTLTNGEDDYRAIGLFRSRDGWYARRLLNRNGYATLGFLTTSGTLSPSIQPNNTSPTVTFRITYNGSTGFTRYFLNGTEVYSASDGIFSANPRIALVAASTNTADPLYAYKQHVSVLANPISVSW